MKRCFPKGGDCHVMNLRYVVAILFLAIGLVLILLRHTRHSAAPLQRVDPARWRSPLTDKIPVLSRRMPQPLPPR